MKKLFTKYIQSVCSPEDFREFAGLIAKKRNEFNLQSAIKPEWERFMEEETNLPANRNVWGKIRLAIEEQEKGAAIRRLKIYTWAFRAAAVFVIAFLVSTVFLLRQSPTVEQVVHEQTIVVPNGARANFVLPDGSVVWLNSASTLTFASDFDKGRSVKLEGEGYFDVIKKDLPFIVATPLGFIEVTGTAFNVKALPGRNQFVTTLERGSVVVTENRSKSSMTLKPGQQVRLLDGDSHGWEALEVETDLYTSWKDGKLIFRKEFLPEVANRLESWYNVKIELDNDPRLEKIHYTGTLEMESFSEVLELLKVTASINYTFNDKTRVIKITHR